MREHGNIYCFGEAVLDIIFNEGRPVAAMPGGSALNAAVSMGRAGVSVKMITECGKDDAGNMIIRFLEENNVSTKYIYRYKEGKTVISLAFLDNYGDAGYSFYKEYPMERLRITMPEPVQGDILLFGSYYALAGAVRTQLTDLLRQAGKNGAFIVYDPNFRKPHLNELDALRPAIIENIGLSSLVRGSDEDFRLIFGAESGQDAFEAVSGAGCPVLAYTRSGADVEFFFSGGRMTLPVPAIKPVSTIGAGDAFNAGIIYGLAQSGCTGISEPGQLSATAWESILNTAIRFSENVCLSFDNYISMEFARTLRMNDIS